MKGRRKLAENVKLNRTVSVRLDKQTYTEVNLLIEQSKGELRSYGDVFRKSFSALKLHRARRKIDLASLF